MKFSTFMDSFKICFKIYFILLFQLTYFPKMVLKLNSKNSMCVICLLFYYFHY